MKGKKHINIHIHRKLANWRPSHPSAAQDGTLQEGLPCLRHVPLGLGRRLVVGAAHLSGGSILEVCCLAASGSAPFLEGFVAFADRKEEALCIWPEPTSYGEAEPQTSRKRGNHQNHQNPHKLIIKVVSCYFILTKDLHPP